MKAYSTDLREQVVAAGDARFSVSATWIRKLMRQRRQTGWTVPKPRGGSRARAFEAEADRRLRVAVWADDDATLRKLAEAPGCGRAERRLPGPVGRGRVRAERKRPASGRA